jgi:hypothetical protein
MEAQAQVSKSRDRNAHAVEVLRRLDEIGAIKLDVMVAKAAEIKSIIGGSGAGSVLELEPGDICYPNYVILGPRRDIDLVSVASELKGLGFEVKRMATVQTQTKA